MSDSPKIIYVPEVFGDEEVQVAYRKGIPGKTREVMDEMRARGEFAHMFNFCAPLNIRTYEPEPGIICMQDVAVKMRDGVTIYTDIYLPAGGGAYPLLISWSMFGKRPAEGMEDWKLMGVPPQTVSKMAKFEACDPAYWCHYGYGVANVDPRGVGNSEGNVSNFGLQDGRDGYDFIEWAAQQSWCTGKVGMFGNSGVGMTQWRIAAEQPPHLSCIAVWEGTGDMYRESFAPGGIPSPMFNEGIMNGIACNEYIEDGPQMLKDHPFMDAYWESKIPRWEKIRVPAYVAAGWCHFHLRGSLEGFRRIRSPKKWLRAHREFEWPDTYNPKNLDDLRKFYDRYLRDIRNGWELTPKVRINVMDSYDYDLFENRTEREFPLARTEYKKLYLDAATGKASYEPFAAKAEVVYDPMNDVTAFEYKFEEDTEITGYMKLHLNIECRTHDNMDMFVWVKKYTADGKYVPITCMNEDYRGIWGYFRGKRRELDPKFSTDYNPVQAHRKDEPMEAGEVYPVDIEIWPTSRMFHKGEVLRIEINGYYIKTEWYEDAKMDFEVDNGDAKHVIHTGGEYDSYLQIPVIPPKWTSGDFVYRGADY